MRERRNLARKSPELLLRLVSGLEGTDEETDDAELDEETQKIC